MSDKAIQTALVDTLRRAATELPADVIAALKRAREIETSALAAAQLDAILENIDIAGSRSVPMCQDTGIQTFFVEAGVDSPHLGRLRDWIVEALAAATVDVPLRPNTVDPFTGANP
ncbi:fumarate hydratase, partial [Candidatus Bipolaricaulota bacterium]|nr:fumarate hydratase [Candidatus Bipolaricaulota bacterium]